MAETNTSGERVFISHARADARRAVDVCAALEAADGLACWIAPRDIRGGQSWPEAVTSGIQTSRVVVVLLSTASNESREVAREVELACRLQKQVVPFRIQNVEPAGGLTFFLSSAQWVDGFRPPLQRSHDALVREVCAALELPPPEKVEVQQAVVEVDLADFESKRPRGLIARLFEDR